MGDTKTTRSLLLSALAAALAGCSLIATFDPDPPADADVGSCTPSIVSAGDIEDCRAKQVGELPTWIVEGPQELDTGQCMFGAGLSGCVVPEPELCLVLVRSLSVVEGATLEVHGPRALVVIAEGDVTIDGTIDASAKEAAGPARSRPGPGGFEGGAAASPGEGQTSGEGGCPELPGGGGGGGHFGAGGASPCGCPDFLADGGPIGAECAPGTGPSALLGGAGGGGGGGPGTVSDDEPGGGPGGAGGGAVMVFAGGTLTVSGGLMARGANGQDAIVATDASGGGGGGGAGGMIVLEAAEIVFAGGDHLLDASGGDGGSGEYNFEESALGGHGGVAPGQAPPQTDGRCIAGRGGGGGGGAGMVYLGTADGAVDAETGFVPAPPCTCSCIR